MFEGLRDVAFFLRHGRRKTIFDMTPKEFVSFTRSLSPPPTRIVVNGREVPVSPKKADSVRGWKMRGLTFGQWMLFAAPVTFLAGMGGGLGGWWWALAGAGDGMILGILLVGAVS